MTGLSLHVVFFSYLILPHSFSSDKKNGIEETDYVPVTTNLSLAFLRSSVVFFLRLAF